MAAECPECHGELMDGPHPNYDHLHPATTESLPRARSSPGRVVTRGYAVAVSGRVPRTWVFFDRIEPAYAFGRAGKMAAVDITSFSLYPAADELRWDADKDRDIRTLLVALDASLREAADDQDLIDRWVRGTSPRSSYFQPPAGKQALAGTAALTCAGVVRRGPGPGIVRNSGART